MKEDATLGIELPDIAIHPPDQLTRRARVVKPKVELQQVQGQIGPQVIRRVPRHPIPNIRRGQAHALMQNRETNIGQTRHKQGREHFGSPAGGGVDEEACDLRIDQLQCDAAKQQGGSHFLFLTTLSLRSKSHLTIHPKNDAQSLVSAYNFAYSDG